MIHVEAAPIEPLKGPPKWRRLIHWFGLFAVLRCHRHIPVPIVVGGRIILLCLKAIEATVFLAIKYPRELNVRSLFCYSFPKQRL